MNIENYIKHRLNAKLNGKMEVKTPFGRVDILTFNTVYELKEVQHYKHGVGQLLDYKKQFPGYKLKLVSFGEKEKIQKRKEHIESYCKEFNIIPSFVTFSFSYIENNSNFSF